MKNSLDTFTEQRKLLQEACNQLATLMITKVEPVLRQLKREALEGSAISISDLESLPKDFDDEHVVVQRTILYTGKVSRVKKILRTRGVRGETVITGSTEEDDVSIRSID